MQISLLGPIQILRDDRPLNGLTYDKVRALLAYLVTEAGRPHSRDSLADLLWPEQTTEEAHHNLRQALANLRRYIGDYATEPAYLITTRNSIQFNVHSNWTLDVNNFRSLIAKTRQHAHRRVETCTVCARHLEQVVEIYKGDFLSGFSGAKSATFEEWMQVKQDSLRSEALYALSTLGAYCESRGAYDRSGAFAARQLEMDPWREDAYRQSMRALYLSGNRAGALLQYERCRYILASDLGVEPEQETTHLYKRIRSQDPSTSSFQGSLTLPSKRPQNLPSQLTPFVGREHELGKLADLLADPDCRLITLTGPGGIGKTRLALQAATEQVNTFTHGVFFIPLASVPSTDHFVAAISNTLGISPYGQASPLEQLAEKLRDRDMLLLLDNFEHLLQASDVVTDILRNTSRLKALVTSREPLNVRGEWIFSVEGLALPSPGSMEDIRTCSSFQLFEQSARRAQAEFSLQDTDSEDVVHICQLVDGMPLGIELAASWIPALSCAEIATEIEASLDFLRTSLRDVPERHRSIRAVFDRSWMLLSDEDREVLRQLSIFRGGFQRDAARAITGASINNLSTLTSKSWLRKDPTGRYYIHELLRQYGEEQLRLTPNEYQQARQAHCRYFAELLAHKEDRLKSKDQIAALNEIEVDIRNIQVSWRWAADHGCLDLIAACADSLWLYFASGHGRYLEGEETFRYAAEAIRGADLGQETESEARDILLAKLLTRQGSLCYRLGLLQKARDLLTKGISICRRTNNPRELAFALNHMAAAAHLLGTYEQERILLQESLQVLEAVGDPWLALYSKNDLGLVHCLLGQYTEAERLTSESLRGFIGTGDRRGIAFALHNRGIVAVSTGAYSKAEQLHRQSLALRRELDDSWGVASSLIQLSITFRLRRMLPKAMGYLLEAVRVANDAQVLPIVLEALVEVATVLMAQGDRRTAISILVAARDHASATNEVREKTTRMLSNLSAEDQLDLEAASQYQSIEQIIRGLVHQGKFITGD